MCVCVLLLLLNIVSDHLNGHKKCPLKSVQADMISGRATEVAPNNCEIVIL